MYRRCLTVVILLVLAGCSTAPPPRTPGMQAFGIEETTAELRYQIYRYEVLFAATVHAAADEIAMTEIDQDIREMAIRWKINAVPTMQLAVFQLDPLAAISDTWVRTAQMERFFTTGNGKELFGDSQHFAVEASRELLSEIRELARSVAPEERIRTFEPRLRAWLEENPITNISFGRRSVQADAATISAADWGPGGLQSVGQIEDLVRDLSDRLTIYATQVPELARAHGELLATQIDRIMVRPLQESFDGIEDSAGSIDTGVKSVRTFLDTTPELIASERIAIVQALQKELAAALTDVDRQRAETIAALSHEREIIFEDVNALQSVLTADLQEARVGVTTDIEAVVVRQAQAIVLEAESLIDMVFWRALILLAIGLIGLAAVLRWARRAPA